MAYKNTKKPTQSKNGKWKSRTRDERMTNDKEEVFSSRKCNDPSWYIIEGQLAKDVASFSFNTPLGPAPEINVDGAGNSGLVGARVPVPGIMRIHTMPAVGYSEDGSSPINLAAKNLYSWVRHANSGHSNYDSPDLMLYIVAMDSIYALIWHMQRAYGTARVYSQKNRYIGDALLRAMGFIPDEIRENLANFRTFINMLIVKASAFCTPTSMSLFSRHTWMYSGVFKDEDVDKSQMYLYIPDFLFIYDENSGAGKCDPLPVCANATSVGNRISSETPKTLTSWYAIANAMINRLVASEDINIMSGDIRKAYGDNGIWKISLISEDYTCVPIYSGEILDQIHNTVFTGWRPRTITDDTLESQFTTYDITSLTVYQDVLAPLEPIIFKPCFVTAPAPSFEHFIDMEENEPSAERVLVGSRNMIHGVTTKYTFGSNDYFLTRIDSCGSDICFFADMMHYTSGGSLSYTAVNHNFAGVDGPVTDIAIYSKFHKAPMIYSASTSAGSLMMNVVYGELGDYIVLDKTDIDKMHQSAILSMLGVPV